MRARSATWQGGGGGGEMSSLSLSGEICPRFVPSVVGSNQRLGRVKHEWEGIPGQTNLVTPTMHNYDVQYNVEKRTSSL